MDEETITKQVESQEAETDIAIVSNQKQRKHGMLAFRLARGDKKNIALIKRYYRTVSASQAIRLCIEDKVKMIKVICKDV